MSTGLKKYQPLHRWTRPEKTALLSALYKYGAKDIEKLKSIINTKSEFEIQKRINIYKRMSANLKTKKLTREGVSIGNIPTQRTRFLVWPNDEKLSQWTNVIANSNKSDSSKNLIPEALRVIAHLESQSLTKTDINVDTKSLYLYLADVIEGKTPTALNAKSREFLINIIINLNADIKKNINMDELNFIENITRIFPDITKPVMPESTPTSHALNELLSSIFYNPLEIPEKFLKMKVDD